MQQLNDESKVSQAASAIVVAILPLMCQDRLDALSLANNYICLTCGGMKMFGDKCQCQKRSIS